MRERFSMTIGNRVAETAMLARAAKLGGRFLSRGKSVFLRRSFAGEVPTWDWKKLNRPATFKKFQSPSLSIQDILTKLLETFITNLEEATTRKEGQATCDRGVQSQQQQRRWNRWEKKTVHVEPPRQKPKKRLIFSPPRKNQRV